MAKAIKQTKPKAQAKKFEFSLPQGRRMYAIIIFCAAFVLYFNSIFNDYNLDDELVTNNQALTSQGWKVVLPDFTAFSNVQLSDSSFGTKFKYFLPQVFRSLYYQDKSGYKYEYRPLVQASFAIEHALFADKIETGAGDTYKDSPHISHFINVILYGLTCVLLFLMLCRFFTGANTIFPFLAALLFVAHPIHTEVVASIKNRDEIMALMFALIANLYALKFAERRKPLYLFLLALAFLLSLLSKPTSITFAMLIPMALIMFTSATYNSIMLVTAVVAILAAFYARFFFVKQQIALFVIILIAVSIAYAGLHFRSIIERLKTLSRNFNGSFKSSFNKPENEEATLNFNFLRNPALILALLLLFTGFLAFAGFAANQNLFWLSFLIGLALALAYILLRSEGRVILITPITLTVLIQLYAYSIHFLTPQIALAIFLSHPLFSNNRVGRIVAGINYVVFAAVCHFIFHTGSLYPLLCFGFLGFYYPSLFFTAIIGLLISLYYEGFLVYNVIAHGLHLNPDILGWPLYQLALFFAWRGKRQWAQKAAVVALPVLMLVFVMVHPPSAKKDLLVPVHHSISNFNYTPAIAPSPVQSTVRPLKYAEFPVAAEDSYSKRFGLAAEVLIRYLKLVIVPYPMSYYYGYAYITPKEVTSPLALLSIFIYGLIALAAIIFYWRKPLLSYALIFYLISISVYTDLIAPIPGVMADRFLLVPSIGFCLILAWGLFRIFKLDIAAKTLNLQSLQPSSKYTICGLLAIYSLMTIARNTDWKDHLTLFRHDISTVENSAQAQNLLAVQLLARANRDPDHEKRKELAEESVGHFKRALEIYPGFVNASFDLARAYEFLNRYDEAYAQYAQTNALDTTFTTPCFYMAAIMHNKGNYQAAIPLYEKYIRSNPLQMQAYANLSYAYFQMKDFDKSIEVNRRALAIAPGSFGSLVNIGKTYIAENKPDSALLYFQMAHAVRPGDNDVNSYIARFSKR
jgi:tetratricopeptide (TPR) repeat protein